jgi:5-methylcytosine-specific restriction endonuclease McrA
MDEVRIPSGLRKAVFERGEFRCLWCGRNSADAIKLHADHIVPESFGGSTLYENLGTLCDQCNLLKGTEYFGNYLLTTIFKVKDIDSKIIHKNLDTGLEKDGKDYDRGFLEERNDRLTFRERK